MFYLFSQIVDEIAQKIMGQVPKPLPLAEIMEKYPVKYEESMNTVLVQEVIRYNRLLKVIHSTLVDLRKALKGLVVMSQALETMFNSIYNNTVPEMWASKVHKYCIYLVKGKELFYSGIHQYFLRNYVLSITRQAVP